MYESKLHRIQVSSNQGPSLAQGSFSYSIGFWNAKKGRAVFNKGVLFFQVFHKRMPPEAVDLVSRLLQYSPTLRCTAVSD